MKFLPVIIIIFLSAHTARSQGFQGIAYYQSKTSMDFNFGGRDIPEAQRKAFQERMKKAFEKIFELRFDQTSSIYKEEVSLEQPGNGPGGMMFSMMSGGNGGIYYKNVQTASYSNEIETFGKIFLIQDQLKQLDWKITGDTKQIGNYTCYKATTTRIAETNQISFRMGPPPRNEEQKEKDSIDGLTKQINLPSEITITAWFTMDIPVAQGPLHYWGLPGLILEVSDDRTTLLCNKIVINPSEKIEIKAPSKGKKVTQVEYDKILKDKLEEMAENFQRGGGRPGAIMIRN